MTLKTVTVDGIPVEVTDQGAIVIATLQKRLDDAIATSAKVLADHAAALADKDKALAAKDAEIDGLKAKVLDAAALDKLVADRAGLISLATAIAKDVKTTGLSDADIRKAVVTAKLGDAAVKDKPQAYIDARFDILAEDAKKGIADPFRKAVQDGITPTSETLDKAYSGMVSDMESAWQHPNGKAA